MSAGEMSDGSPVSPQLDARLLGDLREWRARLAPTPLEGNRWSARLTIDELDMLLRVAAERDALKAALCFEWEADTPAEIRARAVQPEAMPFRAGSTALGIPYAEPTHEPDECGGCVEDIAGGFGLYCSACGKPRPRRTNCRCSVTPILHGHPAPDEVSIEIAAEAPESAEKIGAHCRYCGARIALFSAGWLHDASEPSTVNHPAEPELLPFCDCGSVDKNGDDLGEHGDECPYHLAVVRLAEALPRFALDDLCKRTLAAQARLA